MRNKLSLILAALLASLLLAGCDASVLDFNSMTVITDHVESSATVYPAYYQASTYSELVSSIMGMVNTQQTENTIQVSVNYAGELSEDLNTAIHNVSKEDPLGAYSVDLISTETKKLRSYTEVTVHITYRRTHEEINAITYVRGLQGLTNALQLALNNAETKLILRVSGYSDEFDCSRIVSDYCSSHPDTIMETPTVTTTIVPESGSIRIVEIDLGYQNSAARLLQMQNAVSDAIRSAVVFVSYRDNMADKASLLYAYLADRFEYESGESATPFYSLLCEGIVNSKTLSELFTVLCTNCDIPCVTVTGYLDGIPYSWNIITVDGSSYQIDLMHELTSGSRTITFYYDSDMTGYSWERDLYPVCEPAPTIPYTVETSSDAGEGNSEDTADDPDAPDSGETPSDDSSDVPSDQEPGGADSGSQQPEEPAEDSDNT